MPVSAGKLKLLLVAAFALQFWMAAAQQPCSLPLKSLKPTSSFGARIHPVTGKNDFHKGIDLSARCEPVLSVLQGKVTSAGYHPILGNFVIVDHGGIQSVYGHLRMVLAVKGNLVRAGSLLGITGTTGRTTGGHLHFAVKYGVHYLDPLRFLLGIFQQETGLTDMPN